MGLASIALSWVDGAPAPAVTGEEEDAGRVRPLRAPGRRYARYAEAVAELDRPRLFEDRTCYRLLDVRWPAPASLAFGAGRYFSVMNVCEAMAHELADAALGDAGPGGVAMGRLPLRALVGDPLDLRRRAVLPAITAVTLRWDRAAGSATFVLHWRDPGRVASGGGLYQVMPVGMFQPSGESPADLAADLDLWRGMAREYGEEFLGEPERRGEGGAALDYGSWPFFRALEAARAAGRVRAHCLGAGVDPLTLVADVLVAVVIDAEAFDALFGRLGTSNEEGRIVTPPGGGPGGFALTRDTVEELTAARPMQPAGAAALRLAWRHRDVLLW